MIIPILFSLICFLLLLLHLHLNKVYSRFSKYGVKNLEPLPIIGNVLDIILKRMHTGDHLKSLYFSFPEERFVGRYELTQAIVVIRDLELIKNVTVKHFEHFLDHRKFVDDNCDPIFGRTVLTMKGQEWKDMRSTLSPAFTSSKMRLMVPFMIEVADNMINSLKRQIQDSKVGYVDLESRDLTSRYANDVVAWCAFGVKVDSHTDVDNEFYRMGKDISTIGAWQKLLFLLYTSFPNLMKNFKIKFFSEKSTNFLSNIILNSMRERERNNIVRHDIVHLLMEAKRGKVTREDKPNEASTGFATAEEFDLGKKPINKEWTDTDLVAQAILFFVAAFETSSSVAAFFLHELAMNPDVQDRLVKEIKEQDVKNGGKCDFESVQRLTYLDMVVSEILRRWPPGAGIDRVCTKDYNMGKPNAHSNQDFILRKGEGVLIPVWAFHHNPQFFPDPYKFDPERFSEENKHKITPYTYMPFGLGPRNCIGSRFGLCEIKVMVYQLLKQIEVMPCEKTSVPAKLATDTFNIRIEGGHWVRFKIRK